MEMRDRSREGREERYVKREGGRDYHEYLRGDGGGSGGGGGGVMVGHHSHVGGMTPRQMRRYHLNE